MKKAVVYWSGTGNTEAMAKAVAEAAGAELFTASEFSAAKADEFDAIAFGCPAMGAEALEESEFEPMFDGVKSGWGDGDWMQIWEDDCRAAGINLVHESVTCNGEPDAQTLAKCKALGAAL